LGSHLPEMGHLTLSYIQKEFLHFLGRGFSPCRVMLLTMMFAMGCNGLDNDLSYAVSSQAAVLVCTDSSGARQLVRIENGMVIPNWNASLGVANASWGQVSIQSNRFWISDVHSNRLIKVHPSGTVEAELTGFSVVPHVFAVGERQILLADSSTGRVGFFDLRRGDYVQTNTSVTQARNCLYNGGKFYLQHGRDSITIWDEFGLSPRAAVAVGTVVDEMQFDSFRNLRVLSHDSNTTYVAIIGGNYAGIAVPSYSFDYDKVRYTPYFNSRFGSEVTEDVLLRDGFLQTFRGESVWPDSLENFEVDFFEGHLYAWVGDSLKAHNLANSELLWSVPFPYRISKACFLFRED